MNRVLSLDTRKVLGDLLCIKKLEITDDIRHWFPTMEMFFVTIHNLFPEQVTSDNLRRYFSVNGHITSFGFPLRHPDGKFPINVKALVNIRQPIRFSINAENALGFFNRVNFEFHKFPTLFCGFRDLIGHKISGCARFEIAQQQAEMQQAELQQAEMNAYLATLQQQHEAELQRQEDQDQNNLELQPAMVQEGMEWSEDTLSSDSTSSLASEVTFTDLQKELEDELASQEDRSYPRVSSPAPHMMGYLTHPFLPGYVRTTTKNEASSSQQLMSSSEQDYWNNWNTMEKYFQEDNLPVPKRLRLNEVEMNPVSAEARDVIVIEPTVTIMEHPHQWFNEHSNSAAVQGDDNAANFNN